MMVRMVTHIRMTATMMWKMRPRRIRTWTPVNRLTVMMMMMVMMILTTKIARLVRMPHLEVCRPICVCAKISLNTQQLKAFSDIAE